MTIHQKVTRPGYTGWFSDTYQSLEAGIAECQAQWPDAVVTTAEMAPNDWQGIKKETCIVVTIGPETLYRAEVIADSSGKWTGNAMRYVTREAAEDAARDLSARWTLVREWRVVPDAGTDVGATVLIGRLGIHHGSAVCIGRRGEDKTCTWRHVSRPAWFDGAEVIEDRSLQEVMRKVIEEGERRYGR